MMEKILTYQQAFEELQMITEQLESEEVSVDELAKKVKQAAELLEVCNAKLKSTENEVNKIIESITQKEE